MKYIIVGGGIAGVSCASQMLQLERSANLEVIIISASSFVKSVENYQKIGQYGEKFDVKETNCHELFPDSRIRFLNDTVVTWDSSKNEIHLQNNEKLKYDKLCIATGSRPKFQKELGIDRRIVFLRDTQSAIQLKTKLKNAKNILIVGNGGIATELIFELKTFDVTWLIKDPWICASFFPEDIEQFIEKRLLKGRIDGNKHDGQQKHLQHVAASESVSENMNNPSGPALGPDWCSQIDFQKISEKSENRSVTILRNCVITSTDTSQNLSVHYMDKEKMADNQLNPDIFIWAGGVTANSEVWAMNKMLQITENSGIKVNDACETSLPNVFACGDVCALTTTEPSTLWQQRQLWTQARQQGEVCGRAMVAGVEEARMQNMYFELFSHCTTFFGLKVVFLGDYKPERQVEGEWKIVLRDADNDQLVRCVVVKNKIVGALLIGETDMEETLENLILNKTDLEGISETFLEPGVDLDDYFD